MSAEPDHSDIAAAFVSQVVRRDIEINFAAMTRSSELVRNALARIEIVSRKVPRARASVQVYSADSWFEIYRQQIVWDENLIEQSIKKYRGNSNESVYSLDQLREDIKLAVVEIKIDPGLVQLRLTETAPQRIYSSVPLQEARRHITTLKRRLLTIASAAVNESIAKNSSNLLNGPELDAILNDDLGSVVFEEKDGVLEIVSSSKGQDDALAMLVFDALTDLDDAQLLLRVEQRSKRAGAFVREYADRFASDESGRDLLLYAMGIKITTALPSLEHPNHEDEELPLEFIDGLKTLLIHHEAYVWAMPRIRELIEARRRTLESYSTVIVTRSIIQTQLLQQIGQSSKLVGPRTQAVIQEIDSTMAEKVAVGPEAIQFGLLRGALQSMGRIVVQARKGAMAIAKAVTTKVVVSATVGAIVATPLYTEVQRFFAENIDRLHQLSQSAADWRWLQYLMNLK